MTIPTRASDRSPRQIGIRMFTDDDQRRFAQASLDRNPIHVNPLAARRLLTGRQVVHGINLLFVGLEYWQHANDIRPLGIRCTFDNPVSIGETVIFMQHQRDADKVVIDASVKGLRCARILITTGSAVEPEEPHMITGTDIENVDEVTNPFEKPPEAHFGKRYAVTPQGSDVALAFQPVGRIIGAQATASLAAVSYFVGMICPGVHSVLSMINIHVPASTTSANKLVFNVANYDSRFRLFDIRLEGTLVGHLEAFVRQPPMDGPSVAEIAECVHPDEFAGSRSLVIGGSRGLGALTAKLLSAGGGDVVITYATGLDEARRVADEINEHFQGKCRYQRLDITTDTLDSVSIDCEQLDAVYFFATPRIFRKAAGVFDPEWLREFMNFYVEKLYDVCIYLEAHTAQNKICVYFPSSTAVEDRPKGLTEYAMAKAAAEILIEDINRSFKRVRVVSSRLPRLNTDQTASIQSVETIPTSMHCFR